MPSPSSPISNGTAEEVLLKVPNVKLRDGGIGTLVLFGTRISWIPDDSNVSHTKLPNKKPTENGTVSHKYAEIKTQKISPDGKPKIQLQIVLMSDDSSTFQFFNPMGPEEQKKDRESVKELLQQILPRFRKKPPEPNEKSQKDDAELSARQKILLDHPDLMNLFKELVTTNVISAEEFWSTFAKEKLEKAKEASAVQKSGVSSGFLGEISRRTENVNEIKFNLTPDVIESIFRTYPSVRQKHFEMVPHLLTEKEFWKKFLESQYFHRDRIGLEIVAKKTPDDFFLQCAKQDDAEMEKMMEAGPSYRVCDLPAIQDNYNRDDGYGLKNREELMDEGISAKKSMLKNFNFHSTMVLKACLDQPVSNSEAFDVPPPAKQPRLAPDNEDLAEITRSSQEQFEALSVNFEEKVWEANQTRIEFNEKEAKKFAANAQRVFSLEESDNSLLNDPSSAVAILCDLSTGGRLMQPAADFNSILPPQIVNDIRTKLYIPLAELLRHFWRCFPVTSPALEQKLRRMAEETLPKFKTEQLEPMRKRVNGKFPDANVFFHLDAMLDAVNAKYRGYLARKQK